MTDSHTDNRPPQPRVGTRRTSYQRRLSSPRMASFDYTGGFRYHVTIATHERKPHFRDDAWARRAVDELLRIAPSSGFTVDSFCVMPDHVHLLVAGGAERASSLPQFIHRYKQSLGFRFKSATGEALWQRSYHEHVLRSEEKTLVVAAYIVGNPVRAGLAVAAGDWPYSGPAELFVGADGADRSKDLSLRLTSSLHPSGDAVTPASTPTTRRQTGDTL